MYDPSRLGTTVLALARWSLALGLASGVGTARASPTVYQVDVTHTFAIWEVKHFGTSTSRGRFEVKSGTVSVDWDAQTGSATIVFDMTKPDTGVGALDTALKAGNYLDTDTYPEARFEADQFTIEDKKVVSVRGNLTLRDKTRPVVLTSKGFNCYFNPLVGRRVCGGDFEADIVRSDFGVRGGLPFVADAVHLLIQIEAITELGHDAAPRSFPGQRDDM
jgi:polyisoprenoid-binding protein YceI